jgi:hypothetical protein
VQEPLQTSQNKVKSASVTGRGAVKTGDNSEILPLTVTSAFALLAGSVLGGLKIKNKRKLTESSIDE